MSKIYTYSLIFLFSCICASAQDISGKWVGKQGWHFQFDTPDSCIVEISLSNDSLISGIVHSYYSHGGYEHNVIHGVYRNAESRIYMIEDSNLVYKFEEGDELVLGHYTLVLTMTDTVMRLDGKWRANDESVYDLPIFHGVKIWLEKQIPKRRIQNTVTDKNLRRAKYIQSLIEISALEKDSIKVEIWDNAQIDGDVISMYENDSLILYSQRIDTSHIQFYISVNNSNPLMKLMLAAESQGSVPPCTAHMRVTTKLQQYEIDLSSDSHRNGTLEFFLKE